jgi:hypothetical protein
MAISLVSGGALLEASVCGHRTEELVGSVNFRVTINTPMNQLSVSLLFTFVSCIQYAITVTRYHFNIFSIDACRL